jgi:hypothetical protein
MTDLTDFMPTCQPANVFVELFVQPNATASGLIASAEFFVDLESDGSYEIAVAPDLPVVVRPGADGAAFLPLFADVSWGDWAYDEIEACFCAGVVSGYPDGTYHPEHAVTRDQMAVYISRALAGGDAVPGGPAEPTFLDVPPGHWAYDYIEYAADADIVTGYQDGTYQPGLALDRAQMAVFVARSIVDPTGEDGLAEYAPPAVATFPDVQPDFWAYAHVEYIADPTRAIAQGYSDGRYHPEYICTRDQMAVYMARAFKLSM